MENLSARIIADHPGSSRIIAEKIGRRRLRLATERAILDAAIVHKELANRKLDAIGDNIVFPQADL